MKGVMVLHNTTELIDGLIDHFENDGWRPGVYSQAHRRQVAAVGEECGSKGCLIGQASMLEIQENGATVDAGPKTDPEYVGIKRLCRKATPEERAVYPGVRITQLNSWYIDRDLLMIDQGRGFPLTWELMMELSKDPSVREYWISTENSFGTDLDRVRAAESWNDSRPDDWISVELARNEVLEALRRAKARLEERHVEAEADVARTSGDLVGAV